MTKARARVRRTAPRKSKKVTVRKVHKIIENDVFGHSSGHVWRYKRNTYVANLVTQTGGASVARAFSFKLTDLPNYTEFTDLYDEYKIEKVVLQFIAQGPTPATTAAYIPWFMYAIDYDDSTVPGSYEELQQYDNVKITRMDKNFKVSIQPRFATMVYKGVTTGYGARRGWCDVASNDVVHYGFKLWAPTTLNTGDGNYNVFATYHLAFRGSR